MQEKIRKIEKRVEELFNEADIKYCGKKYFFNTHIKKVKELALKIAENHKVDREVVVLGSLLHDLGYIYEPSNHNNPIYAREIMEEFGVDDEVIKRVCKIVENHKKCEAPDIETRIVQLADKLSHLNIDFLRMIKKIKKDDFENWFNKKLKTLEICLKKNIKKL